MRAARVLVVDDNRDLGENLGEILLDAGYETDVFDVPEEALRALVPGRYSVAVLDLRMPTMDGVDLYRVLRALDPSLRALAMTAYALDERVREALAAGMYKVLPKPLSAPELLDGIENALVPR